MPAYAPPPGSLLALANTWSGAQAFGSLTNAVPITATNSLTGSSASSIVSMVGTWNTSGTPTALSLSITDTASNAASMFFTAAKSGVTQASLSKFGALTLGTIGSGNGLTASSPTLVVRQRMNNSGVAFTLSTFNFEDQSSLSTSKVMEWQATGTTIGYMQKNGLFVVGPSAPGSADSAMAVTRPVTTAGSGNAHGFVDNSTIGRTGTIGYASFDAANAFGIATNYDHYAAFQSRPTYAFTGTIGSEYAVFSASSVNSAATVTNRYAVYMQDGAGLGTITNQYGLYVESLTKGATSNYGVYVAGANPSYFGGKIILAVGTVGTLGSASPAGQRSMVNDALTPAFGSAVVGGGAETVPVYSTGATWNVG